MTTNLKQPKQRTSRHSVEHLTRCLRKLYLFTGTLSFQRYVYNSLRFLVQVPGRSVSGYRYEHVISYPLPPPSPPPPPPPPPPSSPSLTEHSERPAVCPRVCLSFCVSVSLSFCLSVCYCYFCSSSFPPPNLLLPPYVSFYTPATPPPPPTHTQCLGVHTHIY